MTAAAIKERAGLVAHRTPIILALLAALVMLTGPGLGGDGNVFEIQQARAEQREALAMRQAARLTIEREADLLVTGESAQARNATIPFAKGGVASANPFRAIAVGGSGYRTALSCLTEAVYYEAATEPMRGRRGVAQVVLNRVRHPAYPNSVCGVVYQGSERRTGCQFSFTCDGSLSRRPSALLWEQSREVAEAALAGAVEPSVGSATHYHADYVLPRWAFTLAKVHQEGRHIFYRFPGRAGTVSALSGRWSGLERKPAFNPERFAAEAVEDIAVIEELAEAEPLLAPDPTDRRAPTDVGGRLDTRTEWRMTIPDPTAASAGYRAAQQRQEEAADKAVNETDGPL